MKDQEKGKNHWYWSIDLSIYIHIYINIYSFVVLIGTLIWFLFSLFVFVRMFDRSSRARSFFKITLYNICCRLTISSFEIIDSRANRRRRKDLRFHFIDKDYTMRLNKLLFLVFLIIYFIAGLSLLITGSVAHRQASQCKSTKRVQSTFRSLFFLDAEITGHSLMSGAGFIIALGVIIILLSALGKACIVHREETSLFSVSLVSLGLFGTYTNRLDLLKIFIASLVLILLLELIAAIVGFTLRNKGDQQLRTNLFESMPKYFKGNSDVVTEWDRLQQRWSCCGVNKWQDWNETITGAEIPRSCCLRSDCTPPLNGTAYFDTGCYSFARNLFFRYSKALGGVSLFFFFVELVGLGLAIHLFRDLKNNYGAV